MGQLAPYADAFVERMSVTELERVIATWPDDPRLGQALLTAEPLTDILQEQLDSGRGYIALLESRLGEADELFSKALKLDSEDGRRRWQVKVREWMGQ